MGMKNLVLAAALASVAAPGLATAADIEAGKKRAGACAACHGPDGKAMIPTYPHLAGQQAGYLELALKAYREKTRTGGQAAIMHSQAARLSDDDIANLAAYYASLAP